MSEGGGEEAAPLVLVVDDDPLITSSVARIVRRAGLRVATVNDPYEAVELLEREGIDLVITDKDMPQMSGHALLDLLRERHPDVPCIMLTGVPTLESALVAINSDQVIRYLTKPWHAGELEETITTGLERRAALRRAAAERRAADEREAVLAALHARDPGLRAIAAGELVIAPTLLADALDELVSRHLEGEGGPLAGGAVETLTRRASPRELADALAFVPLRHATVGVVLSAGATQTRLAVDVRGYMHTVLDLPVGVGDVVAARLAVHAAIDPATSSERLGRLNARVADGGAGGQLVIGYQRGGGGASVEVRRMLVGADAPAGGPAVPQQVGPYRLLDVLGQGGMGTVYRGVHVLLERTAAVKLLRGVYGDDPITVARFMREARAATRARHPGIVETYDFGHLSDGRPYMVMELIDAPTLQQRLRRGPLAPLDAVRIARDIAGALGAAHRADVIHRDLKPANVFVDARLAVKLADFGAAKILEVHDDLTRNGVTLGTPSYMSPEHITGKSADGRTDLYALGCVLFEMLSGRAPYKGDTRSVLTQHLHAEIPEAKSESGALPPALVALVKKAMAKDPRERHASADELAAELAAIADGLAADEEWQ